MMKKISLYLSVFVTLCVATGYVINYTNNFALASDVLKVREELKLLHQQFQQENVRRDKRYTDDKNRERARDLDHRIWTLKQRYVNKPMPQSVSEELHASEVELGELRRQGY